MIRWIVGAAVAVLLTHGSARAQNQIVLPACGTAAYTTGAQSPTQDQTGRGCVSSSSTITGSLPAGTNIIGRVGIDQTTPGTTNGVQVNAALPAGTNSIGAVTAPLTGTGTNPTSTLTRPSNTTAYAGTSIVPQLIASNTAAGSIVVPSFAIQNAAGAASISRVRLSTNVTTGWAGVNLLINLWSAAPTYTNGDGGTWAPATGAASWLGTYTCTMLQFGDGATCQAVLLYGSAPLFKLASGTSVFWDIENQSAATPISAQTFTVTPEIFN